MIKGSSEKILVAGAVLGGAYILYKTLIDPEIGEGAGVGSIGGSDDQFEDDLLGYQGFDIDPNSQIVDYDPYKEIEDSTKIPINEPVIEESNKDISDSNDIKKDVIKGSSPITDTSPILRNSINSNIINDDVSDGSIPTIPQFGLGVLGLTGSYASAIGKTFGENVFKNVDDAGLTIWKRTQKEAINDIPIIGKKGYDLLIKNADDVVLTGAKTVGKSIIKESGEVVAESGFKAVLKNLGKKISGYGLKAVPFLGVGAGTAFDIATTPEYKADYEAGGLKRAKILAVSGTAQVVGDVLGSFGAVATTPAVATGVGSVVPVAVGIGGQVLGEQLVYKPYDWINNFFNNDDDDDDVVNSIVNTPTKKSYIPETNFNNFSNVTSRSSKSSKSSSSLFFNPTSPTVNIINSPSSSNYSSSSSKKSVSSNGISGIDTIRFVANSYGGYSDTVAQQSVSKSVAEQRSLFSSRTSSSRSSSKNKVSTKPTTTKSTPKFNSAEMISRTWK